MAEILYKHPLKMPSGWVMTPVNATQYQNSFSQNMTIDEALRFLDEELKSLNYSATIYTNYNSIINPRLRKQSSANNGVSVIIHKGQYNYHLACDKWGRVEHNIYALYLTIHSLSNIEEWGIATKEYTLSLFSGAMMRIGDNVSSNSELNSNVTSLTSEWMATLGLGSTASLSDANAIYRNRAKLFRDDEEHLLKLNAAIEEARKYLR